jgi:hypothetical protein
MTILWRRKWLIAAIRGRLNNGSRKAREPSDGRGYHAALSPPTLCVFS